MIELLAFQSEPYEIVDLCDVMARPAAYNGKLISISGVFRTDWHHATLIVGQACRGGIWFLGEREVLGEPWDRIEATRWTRDAPKISLTVEGRFRWNPDATGTWAVVQAIEVQRIVSLEMTPE